jgi:hypothetical protein
VIANWAQHTTIAAYMSAYNTAATCSCTVNERSISTKANVVGPGKVRDWLKRATCTGALRRQKPSATKVGESTRVSAEQRHQQ